jgi:hypothetical protein
MEILIIIFIFVSTIYVGSCLKDILKEVKGRHR